MKKFEKKYKSLSSYNTLLFDELRNWCNKNKGIFAISGSSISGDFINGSDFDFILIVPNKLLKGSDSLNLPKMVKSDNWMFFKQEFEKGNLDVFGTFSSINPINRIEIYPETVASQILHLEKIIIRRLKYTPTMTKNEFFYNYYGEKKTLQIQPQFRPNSVYSETQSIISGKFGDFWGMHVERLFLSIILFDKNSNLNSLKRKLFFLLWNKSQNDITLFKNILKKSFHLTKFTSKTIDVLYEEFINIY